MASSRVASQIIARVLVVALQAISWLPMCDLHFLLLPYILEHNESSMNGSFS